ncbi:hypothetical protein S83_070175, partial [Arachis hypogaea]
MSLKNKERSRVRLVPRGRELFSRHCCCHDHRCGCKNFPKDSRNGKEERNLVFVLIDEVESLAAARKAAISGSEPSDSIRVVNALLTQIDKLISSPNVIILITSNITTAI